MLNSAKNNPIVHLATVMWKYAKGYRRRVVVYVLLAILAICVDLCFPMVIGELMNAVQTQTGDSLLSTALRLALLYVALGFVFEVLHRPSRVLETAVAFQVKRAMQSDLFRKVTELPMRWQKDNHSGQTIDQINRATEAMKYVTESGFEVIHLVTRVVGAIAALTWLMWGAGVAVIASGLAAIAVILLIDRRLIAQYEALNKRFNAIAAVIQDYLTNVGTIISLRLESRVSDEVDRRTDRLHPLVVKNAVTNEIKWFSASRFVQTTQISVLLGYLYVMVQKGALIEFGTVFTLWRYLSMVGESFYHFTWKYGELVMLSTRVKAIEHIYESHSELVLDTSEVSLPTEWKKLEIADLRFCHSDSNGQTPVSTPATLRGVDLTLEKGKSYALVGASGGGKSTALGLIRGIHVADEVTVCCDNKELADGMRQIASHTTLIPQDPELFGETIRFNVTLGVEASDAAVHEAVRLACFDEVLQEIAVRTQTDKPLETHIAEKGVSLSGGQKQRLAVARGLFFALDTGSDIVLLDEPTSSVDAENEVRIYKNVLQRLGDKCVVTAIHKFNLLGLFDEILVFKSGQIVERGSQSNLLANKGEFKRLFDAFHRKEDVQLKDIA